MATDDEPTTEECMNLAWAVAKCDRGQNEVGVESILSAKGGARSLRGASLTSSAHCYDFCAA
jgi:hypothetical protein